MVSLPVSRPDFVSVFDREFDVAVCGAGFVGFAAARALAAQGLSTILVESSGDLLWEATRALENSALAPSDASPGWADWLAELRREEGADDAFFEPALAEILAAQALSAPAPGKPEVLLYAAPVAVERDGAAITSVIVATKSGPRRVRALRWLDATERGDLARHVSPSAAPRAASRAERSLLLYTREPGQLDAVLARFCENDPTLRWSGSSRPEERRLTWTTSSDDAAWHRRVPELVASLRALAGAETPFVLGLCANRVFPIYAHTSAPSLNASPANLLVASPALRGEKLVTPADRFSLGVRLALEAAKLPTAASDSTPAEPALPVPSESAAPSAVLVAGAGTGGAVAAISAARAGASVRAIDFTSLPGGVGTGAGICGYFHGAKGGLQTEIDDRTRQLTELFGGAAHGWHHEAKRFALHALFAEAGVEFVGDAFLAGVERDDSGRVSAALAVIDGRLVRLPAAAFVDGTGDGDLAALAGARFVEGRPGDGRSLSYSQSVFSIGAKDGRPVTCTCNFDAGWVDPTDAEDLTRARLIGIAQHHRSPWTHAERPYAVSSWIGLRQSRQIEADQLVTLSDLVEGSRFEDSVGHTETVADTHSVDYEFETDEMAFYYWTCRGFRTSMRCELPYRMMLPRGLENVWVACRAAGISVEAAYGLRMQRDMQRLGEAAGIAAARAAARGTGSRGVDLSALQSALVASGAKAPPAEASAPESAALLEALDRGLPGMHLWHLFRDRNRHETAVRERLSSGSERVSFYAAALLAMWGETAAEPRLITALERREDGPAPEEKPVVGAFAQCIDLPFWLQAALLLRRVGTAACLPALRSHAATPGLPLNARTILALTLERIAARTGPQEELLRALEALTASTPPDPVLPPSRSLWRTLHDEPQKKLSNDRGAPVAQDHTWQLHLVVTRTLRALRLPAAPTAPAFEHDPRAFVRRAFKTVFPEPVEL